MLVEGSRNHTEGSDEVQVRAKDHTSGLHAPVFTSEVNEERSNLPGRSHSLTMDFTDRPLARRDYGQGVSGGQVDVREARRGPS